MLNPADFRRALLSIDALGSTPAILAQVATLAKQPDTDLTRICEIVRNDGPLSADIIRISNSPYYSLTSAHGNLAAAANHIGLQEVVRVVNLSLSRQLFARDLGSYGMPAYDYWSASVATALVMESLAERSGLDKEDAYTIGILHGIGRLLINRVIEENGLSIFWDGLQPIEAWERDAVGFDFAEAGAMLLERWRFPASTCEVVGGQLKAGKSDEPVSLLVALQFTRRLLAATGSDFSKEGWCLPEGDPFMVAAKLTPDEAAKIVTGCQEEFRCILQSVDWN